MAPTGQGTLWSEVLCCPLCSVLFSLHKPPVNLSCGHAVCRVCLSAMQSPVCPLDQTPVRMDHKKMPVNWALLSILGIKKRQEPQRKDDSDEGFSDAEAILIRLSSHLHKADSERGGSIWSDELSRPLQRKLFSLICLQLLEDDGRYKALKMIRSLSERIICELLIAYQNASHISSNLWSAVRARGCQFLGPAMQEEVLRLILLTLSEGALIARKTLVMYIVQTLTDDYPQVSKTCVGHVVQLLYRASCFNVIKRDGESSLMQLKTEFRDYESLRREHDSQIVQVAIDAGLRISPDQWSSLLYGDQSHRSHMQSIIDKLQSPQTFTQLIKELSNTLQRVNTDSDAFSTIITDFEAIDSFDLVITELPSWSQTVSIFEALDRVLHAYVRFNRKRAEQRSPSTAVTNCFANLRRLSSLDYVVSRDVRSDNRYKTRLCRDVEAGRACRRGLRCTYAHCDNELRRTPTALKPSLSLPIRGENGSVLKRINECDGFVNDSNDTATLQHNIVSCMSNAPPTLPRLNSPRAPPPPCNAQQITAPNPGVPIIPMRMPPQPPNQNAVLFDSAQPMQVPLPVVPVIIPPARYIDSANSPNAPIQIAPQNQMRPPVVNQQMMMSRVWPNGMNGTQGLSNAMIAPNTVIQFPIHAPPPPHQPQFLPPPNQPQLHINHNQNALQWTQNCVNGSALNEQPPPAAMIPPSAGGGALQMNLPLECVETQWNIVDRTTCRSAPVQPVAAFEEIVHHGEMNNYRIMKRSEQEDEEQLMMRRKEIISRLVDINQKPNGISVCEESFDEDDLQSHVSYTVASSVLYDDKDTFTSTTLHLPPLPLRFTSASNVDDAVNCLSDLNKTTTVLTVCPPPCVWTNIAKPATVQSPCSVMTIKDMINLPLATPAIQRSHVPHLAVCQMKDSNCIPNSCIPPVIRPLPSTSQDPQNVVSETLDRIVDVRERLNDVEKNSGLGCSVEKQQLKEELNIINRQIQTLDQQTKQSCLLKELEVVDKKIEHLNVHC